MKGENKKPRTSAEVKNRYNKKAYDRIDLTVPKGDKERIKTAAEKCGYIKDGKPQVNTFIRDIIMKKVEESENM